MAAPQLRRFTPVKLLKALLRGMARTHDSTELVSDLVEEEYDTRLLVSVVREGQAPDHDPAVPVSKLPQEGGGEVQIRYEAHQLKDVYLDEYTREPLPLDRVKAAITDELD